MHAILFIFGVRAVASARRKFADLIAKEDETGGALWSGDGMSTIHVQEA